MGTAFNPAKTSPASWDAVSDVDAFVDAVLAELAAMATDGTRSTRSGPKPPLTGAALRKAILAIWCVAFCGLQWRAIGQLCDIPFGTLYSLFAYVHETDRHFHQSDHLRFNHSRHFARATTGPAPWGGACRWRLT